MTEIRWTNFARVERYKWNVTSSHTQSTHRSINLMLEKRKFKLIFRIRWSPRRAQWSIIWRNDCQLPLSNAVLSLSLRGNTTSCVLVIVVQRPCHSAIWQRQRQYLLRCALHTYFALNSKTPEVEWLSMLNVSDFNLSDFQIVFTIV